MSIYLTCVLYMPHIFGQRPIMKPYGTQAHPHTLVSYFPVSPPGCFYALVGAGPASLLDLSSSSSPSPSVAPSLFPSVTCPGLQWPADCGLVSANSWTYWRTLLEAAMNLYWLVRRSPLGSPCWCCERGNANLSA